METPERNWVYCNRCRSYTNHRLVSTWIRADEDPDMGFYDEVTYSVWACLGCDAGTMEVAWSEGGDLVSRKYHPPRPQAHQGKKSFQTLPVPLQGIYGEVIVAYNSKTNVLCAAGLRAIIEGICSDKGIEGDTLEKRIDALEAILPPNIVKHLHELRFMGNEALHDLEPPDRAELSLAIEICEDLLNYLYSLDYKASTLARKREKRLAADTPPEE